LATLNPISVVPNPVPSGQTATVTLTFTLDPGETDQIVVYNDGVQVGTGSITFNGEATPNVIAASTNQGWEIRCAGATLTPLGNNTFRLSA